MGISEKLSNYLSDVKDEHDREWSWVYCYRYFHGRSVSEIGKDRDGAALHLGFYLASWGMYRPSSFLFQHAYTVHLPVIDALMRPEFEPLWDHEFGTGRQEEGLVSIILEACDRVRSAYRPFGEATDTLVTKVLLGTLCCLPAVDTYFNNGYKYSGFRMSTRIDAAFVLDLLHFCRDNHTELATEQARIERECGARYPLTKLVDMFFHQIGLELELTKIAATAH